MTAVKTRDRILDMARDMFNAASVAQVSTNRLAAELGISPGNLHYHFPTKQQLVQALFRRFARSMAGFAGEDESVDGIDDLWLLMRNASEVVEGYRFVHRDIDYLLQEFPELKPRARTLFAGYLGMVRRACLRLTARGVLAVPPDDIEAVARQLVLHVTCWHGFASRLLYRGDVAWSPGYAAYCVVGHLRPYAGAQARVYLDYLQAKYTG